MWALHPGVLAVIDIANTGSSNAGLLVAIAAPTSAVLVAVLQLWGRDRTGGDKRRRRRKFPWSRLFGHTSTTQLQTEETALEGQVHALMEKLDHIEASLQEHGNTHRDLMGRLEAQEHEISQRLGKVESSVDVLLDWRDEGFRPFREEVLRRFNELTQRIESTSRPSDH